jgi:sugar/nucleoside kinase (ribokinase family)
MKGIFWGLLTIDLHFFTDHFPEENTKTKVKKFNSYIGGPATNAAITFQHLGGEAKLVTSIGVNSFNGMIREEIDHFKFDIADLHKDIPLDPVFASIITNETTGERTIFSYNPSRSNRVEIGESPMDYDIALFDGFYIDSAIKQAKACRAKGIKTVFDGGSWKSDTDKLLKHIDIAICSEDFMPPGVTHQEDVTAYLHHKGVKKAVITRGGKPMIINEGEVNLLAEVPKINVVDTLGAGDIFHGAFCFYFAQSNDFLTSLDKAAKTASLSCSFHGPRAWMYNG